MVILSEIAKPAASSLAEFIFFQRTTVPSMFPRFLKRPRDCSAVAVISAVRGKRKTHLVNSLCFPSNMMLTGKILPIQHGNRQFFAEL